MPTAPRRNRAVVAAPLAFVCLAAGLALASDWPQYRGPTHDQHTDEVIRTDWDRQPPKVLWKIPLGESFGSFAAAGDRAYVFVSRGDEEVVLGLDPSTGNELWNRPIDKTIFENMGGKGPRTTPTVDADRVYVMGTNLKLACLNAADGRVLWAHDVQKEFEGQREAESISTWGNAGSPIVEGNLVIVAGGGPGQTFLAFDKTTGSVAWKSGNEKITHATATPATIHGVRQVIFFVRSGLVSVEPQTGKELWRHKFDWRVSTAASPVVGGRNGDVVYCAAGYEVGCGGYKVSKSAGGKFSVKELYRLKRNPNGNHWSTPVHVDGYVYGLFGHNTRATAPLECRDIETGKVMWSQPGFGTGGGLILAGRHLIVQGDAGPITVVDPSPAAYKKVSQFQPLDLDRGDKAWTMPVVAGGKLFARTDKQGACLDVAAK